MSLFVLLTTKCQSVEPGPDFGQASAASDLREPLTREKREPTEAELANPSALVKVWIEPASAHTKSQSLLTRTEIEADERFIIGRRGFGSGRYDYTRSGFQIRDHEPFTVSKRHCAVAITEEGVLVEDLDSRFGTLVNGQRLGAAEGKARRVVLGRGEHDLVIGRRSSQNRFRLIVE